MTYQPYPATRGNPSLAARPAPPRTILNAARLMYAGACLDGLRLVVLPLATISLLHNQIVKAYPHYTAAQIHTAEGQSLISNVLLGVIAVGLWIWMARANAAGRRYARYVASALFGLYTAEVLLTANALTGSKVVEAPVTLLVGGVLVWIVGLVATILLWRPVSRDFYAAADQ